MRKLESWNWREEKPRSVAVEWDQIKNGRWVGDVLRLCGCVSLHGCEVVSRWVQPRFLIYFRMDLNNTFKLFFPFVLTEKQNILGYAMLHPLSETYLRGLTLYAYVNGARAWLLSLVIRLAWSNKTTSLALFKAYINTPVQTEPT